jgi:hypothetical protein
MVSGSRIAYLPDFAAAGLQRFTMRLPGWKVLATGTTISGTAIISWHHWFDQHWTLSGCRSRAKCQS